MSPFLIRLSPPNRQIRRWTDGLYGRVDGLDGWIWSNGQTDWLDGQTDKLNKRTYRWKVGRTDGQADWAECTNRLDGLDGRTDGKDRIDWTGQTDRTDTRAGRTEGWIDLMDGLNGRTDWLGEWIGRMDGRTQRADEGTDGKIDWCTEARNNGQTRLMDVSEVYFCICAAGHLHDGVVLLLRPESFSFFLSYLNFVMTLKFTVKLRKPWTPEKFQQCWLCTGQLQ